MAYRSVRLVPGILRTPGGRTPELLSERKMVARIAAPTTPPPHMSVVPNCPTHWCRKFGAI